MCGISGIIKLKNNEIALQPLLRAMNETLKHRGPNDEGYVFFDNQHVSHSYENHADIAFAHRRLSVIDLSVAAHQPMSTADGKIWIVLNGEIYNYIELRQQLQSAGYHFVSQSDTEVVLYAYRKWGMQMLDHLNGMWSFVIYDVEKDLIFGSRDRFGVKPLYYFRNETFFAFASEQKALLKLPFVEKKVNEKAIFDYLTMSQIELSTEGFYKNIFELEPSHYLTINHKKSSFEIKRYYELNFNETPVSPLSRSNRLSGYNFSNEKFTRYKAETRQNIFNAVEKRLRSDVPIGFCLSGGIDSSSLISVAKQINNERKHSQLGENLIAFTAVNSQKETDESRWAELVVNKLGLKWIKAECNSQDLLSELSNIIYYQDIPLVSTSTYAQYKVMQAARNNGITILIDGQGGDELFAGYVPFFVSQYISLLKNFNLKNLFHEWKHLSNTPLTNKILFFALAKVGIDNLLPKSFASTFAQFAKPEIQYLNKDFWQTYKRNYQFSNELKPFSVNKLLHEYFTKSYLKNLLRWEDRCSMAFGIESRTPFSDDIQLIESVFNIPSTYKIRNGWSKSLLRESVGDLLPVEIRYRTDKLGFATPQQTWLQEINQTMKLKIQESSIDNLFINRDLLIKNWNNIFSEKPNKMKDFVWRYFNYLIWKTM